jgi:glucosamine-phosphate N-acetyltransferase
MQMDTSKLELEYDTLFNICQNNMENIDDIKTQYISLLSFLTETPNITTSQFLYQINEISKMGDIFICYVYQISSKSINILGSGTILYEPKIIHGCKNVGHIEDIVVHENYRTHGIGKNIIKKLINIANKKNCYKVILDCKQTLIPFYEKIGFQQNNYQMTKYF